MSHTIKDKDKLLARVRRIQGQVEAVRRALEEEAGCDVVMHLIAGVRGATSGLMVEVMEDHVRRHLTDVEHKRTANRQSASDQLVDVVRTYFK
jgi:FrmR/RcnR family transcriptional regulator, repressor of frmRAB operon